MAKAGNQLQTPTSPVSLLTLDSMPPSSLSTGAVVVSPASNIVEIGKGFKSRIVSDVNNNALKREF